jgi:hypothetical protein
MAIELHGIIAAYRQLFAVRPSSESFVDNEETDVVEMILRTAVDIWPLDGDEVVQESEWLAVRFMAVGGEELYEQYLRLFDRINGTAFADPVPRLQ